MTGRGLAAALLLACLTGCCTCASSPTFTVRAGAALAPAPAPALGAPAVRILHFGDFGDDTCQQAAVASAMATAHRRAPFDLAVAAGDNIYPCGPDATVAGAAGCSFAPDGSTVAAGFVSPFDPSFARHEEPLWFLGATPVYLALGNHDVATGGRCGASGEAQARLKACLGVAHAGPHWVMPGRHYVVDRGPARLVVVDSNLVVGDYGGFTLDDEVAFVAAQAAACADHLCFLVGHHPPATAGTHRVRTTAEYLARMQRLVDAAGAGRIRAYLAGHDHDLQHVRTEAGMDVLVSGAGALGRWRELFDSPSPGAQLLFASVRWGYGVLEVSPDHWSYRFEDDRSAPLYCCTAVGAGSCEPTSCR